MRHSQLDAFKNERMNMKRIINTLLASLFLASISPSFATEAWPDSRCKEANIKYNTLQLCADLIKKVDVSLDSIYLTLGSSTLDSPTKKLFITYASVDADHNFYTSLRNRKEALKNTSIQQFFSRVYNKDKSLPNWDKYFLAVSVEGANKSVIYKKGEIIAFSSSNKNETIMYITHAKHDDYYQINSFDKPLDVKKMLSRLSFNSWPMTVR